MSCIYLDGRFCTCNNAICDIPASMCKDFKHSLGLHPNMDWSKIKPEAVDKNKEASCIHNQK